MSQRVCRVCNISVAPAEPDVFRLKVDGAVSESEVVHCQCTKRLPKGCTVLTCASCRKPIKHTERMVKMGNGPIHARSACHRQYEHKHGPEPMSACAPPLRREEAGQPLSI